VPSCQQVYVMAGRCAGSRDRAWYVGPALRHTRGDLRRTRLRLAAAGLVAGAFCAALSACGSGGGGQFTGETSGNYPMQVVSASFPPKQRLGFQTYLRLVARNTGDKTIPALAVTISLTGPAGRNADDPFSALNPQPGLAAPSRPVWVLEDGWPRLASATSTAGAATASAKVFDFGPLKAGATRAMVWKLAAVKAGRYALAYRFDAGLSGSAKAVTDSGGIPGGILPAAILAAPEQTRINEAGKIVQVKPERKQVHGVIVVNPRAAAALNGN